MEKSPSTNHLETTSTQEELVFSNRLIEETTPVSSPKTTEADFVEMSHLSTGEPAYSKEDMSHEGTLGIMESGLEIIPSDISCPKAQVRVHKFRVKIEE